MKFKLCFFILLPYLHCHSVSFFMKNLTGKYIELLILEQFGNKIKRFEIKFDVGEEHAFILTNKFIIINRKKDLLLLLFKKTFRQKFGEDLNFHNHKLSLLIKQKSNNQIFLEPAIENIQENSASNSLEDNFKDNASDEKE